MFNSLSEQIIMHMRDNLSITFVLKYLFLTSDIFIFNVNDNVGYKQTCV